MSTVVPKTVNLSDLSEADQKIVTEYHSLIQELFLWKSESSSSCDIYKEEILSFLEMYKSVFGEGDGTWKISMAEVTDQNLHKFRAPYRKLFQENAYLSFSKFPQAPNILQMGTTTNDLFNKKIFEEHSWLYRINVVKREVFLKMLKNKAIDDFQKTLDISIVTLINDLELIYDEGEFRTKHKDTQIACVEKFKSQIPEGEGILSISFLGSELEKELTLNLLSEDTKTKISEAIENAARKISNSLKRCLNQCSSKSANFCDDVEVIFNINSIPSIYKEKLQEKVTACIEDVFKEIEEKSIADAKNQQNLLSIFNIRESETNSKTLGSMESPQRAILRTLPPAPGRDALIKLNGEADDQVSSKTEIQSKNSETNLTTLNPASNMSFGEKKNNSFQFNFGTPSKKSDSLVPQTFTKLPLSSAEQITKFEINSSGIAMEPNFGLDVTPPNSFTFNKNFNFNLSSSVAQPQTNSVDSMVTNFRRVALRKPKVSNWKSRSALASTQPPTTPFDKDLPPLCIHLQGTHIKTGMIINGSLKIFKDEFGNSLIPAVVAYSKQGELSWGSQVETNDMFQLLKHVWWLLQPGPIDDKVFVEEITSKGKSFMTNIEFLFAFFLRKLRFQATKVLRRSCGKAVIIVPAYFTSVQRQQLKHSAEIAGFSENLLVDESVAISYEYCDKNNYQGVLMVLSENLNSITACCMNCNLNLPNDPYLSCISYFTCSLDNFDKQNSHDVTLKARQACTEATNQLKNKFEFDFKGHVCVIWKNNHKWASILKNVGKEFGKGEITICSDAFTGASLFENALSKNILVYFNYSMYDVLIESEETGKLETIRCTGICRETVSIEGKRASVYQLDRHNNRILVASIGVENIECDEVVEFYVRMNKEGILQIIRVWKRSKVKDRVFVSNKEINLSTPNLSKNEMLQYKEYLPFVE